MNAFRVVKPADQFKQRLKPVDCKDEAALRIIQIFLNLFLCIAQQQADIVPGPYPLRQLWTAPELQPAVDQGHPAAHAGEEQGLLQGGVPAPHQNGVWVL